MNSQHYNALTTFNTTQHNTTQHQMIIHVAKNLGGTQETPSTTTIRAKSLTPKLRFNEFEFRIAPTL
jgi:hypothetical protein